MATSYRFVTYDECKDRTSEINKKLSDMDGKMDKMSLDMQGLKTHFNDTLTKEIDKRKNWSNIKMALFVGGISFLVTIASSYAIAHL